MFACLLSALCCKWVYCAGPGAYVRRAGRATHVGRAPAEYISTRPARSQFMNCGQFNGGYRGQIVILLLRRVSDLLQQLGCTVQLSVHPSRSTIADILININRKTAFMTSIRRRRGRKRRTKRKEEEDEEE